MGYRGKLAEQQRARDLRAQAWTLREIAACDAWGRDQVGELDDRDLLIAGTALYAGEGAKRDGMVSLANTNPEMLALFCRWLRTFFDVDESRLRVRLYLHDGLDLDAAVEYWSAITAVPSAQFGKSYRAVPDAGIRASKHAFGCATVTYSCARTHRQVMGLVRALFDPAGGS